MSKLLPKVALFIGVVGLYYSAMGYYKADQDLASAGMWLGATALRLCVRRSLSLAGVYFMLTSLFMYFAHRVGNERAHNVFEVLHIGGLVLYWLSDRIDKWFKKLWGKIKSSALTAVNAASFKRQTKEATA